MDLQNLLQWTGKEHPDCSLLLGSERALRTTLSRCHVILEEEVRWEEDEEAGQRRGTTETFFSSSSAAVLLYLMDVCLCSSCDAAASADFRYGDQVTRDEPNAAAYRCVLPR